MFFLILILIFIFGAAVGSFINVIVDRIDAKKSFLFNRSYCDFCKKPLSPLELIPILSFIAQGGKCKKCKKKLSLYYPFVEILTGSLFVLTVLKFLNFQQKLGQGMPDYIQLFTLFYIIAVLIVIFLTDMKFGIIPFWAVFTGIIATALIHTYTPITTLSLFNYFLSGFGAFAGFLLIFIITRGKGMGFGDVVFVFLMGFLLGYPLIFLSIYLSFLTGAIVSLMLVILKKKKLKGDSIPFGPFLITGTWISIFYGDKIMSRILSYLLI